MSYGVSSCTGPNRLICERELLPGDVLFFRASSWLVKALLRYGHVAIFFDRTKHDLPLVIESIGRGVIIRSLYCYAGQEITVKRVPDHEIGRAAAKAAERIADNPMSWYGYFDIPRFAVPKLVLSRLGGLLPQKWEWLLKLLAFSYRRNNFYICSELVAESYAEVDYPLVDSTTIPLPDDLAGSPKLVMLGTLVLAQGGNNGAVCRHY